MATPLHAALHIVADRIVGAAATDWAWLAPASLLDAPLPSAPIPNIPRIVARSGRFPIDEETGDPDPRTWGPSGWTALERAVRATSSGPRLLVRPAWTDVISDAPSCLKLLAVGSESGGWGGNVGILLDPAAMLAPSMLPNAEDHVRRIMELVAGHAGVAGVIAAGTFAPMITSLTPAGVPVVVASAQPAP